LKYRPDTFFNSLRFLGAGAPEQGMPPVPSLQSFYIGLMLELHFSWWQFSLLWPVCSLKRLLTCGYVILADRSYFLVGYLVYSFLFSILLEIWFGGVI
jgi:hypothetical protein